MSLAPQQLLDRLTAIMPDFADRWASPDNVFRNDDGSFTCCGAFAECSHFVRDHYEQITRVQRGQLGQFISQCMSSPGTDLDNAAATCFLENLTLERFAEDPGNHLSGRALEFYRQFHGA